MTLTKTRCEDVVATARTYIGTDYAHQGRSPNLGLDCTGLLIAAGIELGIERVDPSLSVLKAYPRKPRTPDALVLAFDGFCSPTREGYEGYDPGSDPGPWHHGAIGLFWINTTRLVRHAGLIAERRGVPSLIHAFQGVGRVVEVTFTKYWQDRLAKCYFYPDTEPD